MMKIYYILNKNLNYHIIMMMIYLTVMEYYTTKDAKDAVKKSYDINDLNLLLKYSYCYPTTSSSLYTIILIKLNRLTNHINNSNIDLIDYYIQYPLYETYNNV